MAIKLIVLDIAGTTVKDDNNVSKAFQLALKEHGFIVSIDMINPLMGYEKKEAILRILEVTHAETKEITIEEIELIYNEFVRQMVAHYKYSPGIEALPQVEETLLSLRKKGIKIGINTGFPIIIAETIISRLQWRKKKLIDFLIGSDEVKSGRPYPYMIEKIMKELNITDSKEVVKVGDTEVDIREGKAAGCKYVIGITTGTFTREELEKYEPTHIIDNISEILPILNV